MTAYEDIHLANRQALIEQHKEFLSGKVFLEFGVYHGTSMLMWHDLYQRNGLATEFIGFDSFQGIPKETEDANSIADWKEGAFSTHGVINPALQQRDGVRLVTGFFEDSLTDSTATLLEGKEVGIVHVDCDTYSSTKTVLNWLLRHNLLSKRTLIVYDDWGGYLKAGCDEYDLGEAKAHKEVAGRYGKLFVDLGSYTVDPKFYVVKVFKCDGLVFRVDVDDTICFCTGDREYAKTIPNHENIAKINALYDKGHTIVYWTARGSCSGLDWYDLTKQQLEEWGAKHHRLECNKPYFDTLIDDRALRIEEV